MRRTILSSILVMLAGIAHAQTPECNRLCSRDFMFSLESGFDVITLVADGEHANGFMEDGRVPLIWGALDPDDEDAIYFTSSLLFAGGDVHARDKKYGQTPLHWHMGRTGGPLEEVVAMFLEKQASVLNKDKFGYSVLDFANGNVNPEVLGLTGLPYVRDEIADMIREAAENEVAYRNAVDMHNNEVGGDVPMLVLKGMAIEGFSPAQFTYAVFLESRGDDATGSDNDEDRFWFEESWEPGSTDSDIDQALYWFEESANSGFIPSIYHLGSSAYKGTSLVEQNDALAHMWLSLGARKGDTKSQALLSLMHANGRGVERDIQKGLMWMIISLRFGENEPERERLSHQMVSALSHEEVIEAEKMAKECIMGFFEHC